jgi:hypothetical protein
VSQLFLQACKAQGQFLFHGWWPVEGTRREPVGSPNRGSIWWWRPGAPWGVRQFCPGKVSKAWAFSALTQKRNFRFSTLLSGKFSGLDWTGPISFIQSYL